MNREQSHPPALATWLLRRLCPKQNREAITGDLLERFREGRSDGWFWRQVLAAILVGVSRQLRVHWSQICFAAAGTGLLWWSRPIMYGQAFGGRWVWSIGLPFPLPVICNASLVETVRALVAMPVLAVFLLIDGAFGWVGMLRAFLICLLLFAVGDLASAWLFANDPLTTVSRVSEWLAFREARFFFTLLISAWVGCPLPVRSERIAL